MSVKSFAAPLSQRPQRHGDSPFVSVPSLIFKAAGRMQQGPLPYVINSGMDAKGSSLYVTKQQALIIPNTVNDYEDIWKFITDKLDKLQIHQEKII
jgi:hypothetical protein